MLLIIINSIFLLLLSIIIHELGHLIILRYVTGNKNIKTSFVFRGWKSFHIKTGTAKDYIFLSDSDKLLVYGVGIISGLIVILLFGSNNPFYLLMLVPYLFGCESDLINMWGIIRKKWD